MDFRSKEYLKNILTIQKMNRVAIKFQSNYYWKFANLN